MAAITIIQEVTIDSRQMMELIISSGIELTISEDELVEKLNGQMQIIDLIKQPNPVFTEGILQGLKLYNKHHTNGEPPFSFEPKEVQPWTQTAIFLYQTFYKPWQ